MRDLGTSLLALAVFTVLTGLVYPACITLAAHATMPARAHGSLVERDGVVVGSALIGQDDRDPRDFWPRPSATQYESSGGDNLAPASTDTAIPADLVTTSASGLDPDISPAAAYFQAPRVARARGVAVADVNRLIAQHISPRLFGLFGDPCVNVLALNLALP